ncbi:hypothetical protein Q9323_15060 [Pseudomonas fulva]|uniref:hypothetical protein n=1 Tax=Pseudomonas fulva TaxID=47880 RepID=UPI0031F66399
MLALSFYLMVEKRQTIGTTAQHTTILERFNMAIHARVCKQCGDKFLARSAKGVFCTPLCGKQHRRAEASKQQAGVAVKEILDDVLSKHC